jgi:hypothetical protein
MVAVGQQSHLASDGVTYYNWLFRLLSVGIVPEPFHPIPRRKRWAVESWIQPPSLTGFLLVTLGGSMGDSRNGKLIGILVSATVAMRL